MKNLFDKKQEPVTICKWGSEKESIFICLNERPVEEPVEIFDPNTGELSTTVTRTMYEYDYCEILETIGAIDHTDLIENPSNYLDYTPVKEKTLEEKVKILEEQNDMLTNCILDMTEIIYQ